MKPVISLKDLEEMVRAGKDPAAVPSDALLTPSARDFLRDREGYGTTKSPTETSKAAAPAKPVTSKSSKEEIEAYFNSPTVNEFKRQICDIGRRLWQRAYVDGNGGNIAIRVGEVRRIVAASPGYLARHPVIREPADLSKHQIISMTHFGLDSWSFPPAKSSSVPRSVQFTPRLIVNTVRAAIDSAVEGHGVTRLFSYHIAEEIREGRMQILLGKDEHPPLPAHLLVPQGRLSVPKVRAFVDFAAPRLKRYFTRLTNEASRNAAAIRSRGGRVPSR
jgi:hypothetical protein